MKSSEHPSSLFDNDVGVTNAPLKIKLPVMAVKDSPPAGLRRSTRRRGSDMSGSGGPSGSEYQQSEKSEPVEPEPEEEEEEEPPEMITTRRGRAVAKKNYVESNDEEDLDAEGEPDIQEGDLMNFKEEEAEPQRRTTRSSTRAASRHASAEDSNDGVRMTRSKGPTNRLSGFIVSDEGENYEDDDDDKPRTRSRITRGKPLPRPPNGRNRSRNHTATQNPVVPTTRARASKLKEDDYNPGLSPTHSADADGSDEEDGAPGTDDLDLDMDIPTQPEPEAEPEDEASGTDGKPYALRQRAKINYAIPPPLEELHRPPQKSTHFRANGVGGYAGGRGGGYHGKKKGKGLGWSASGAELGKWMGLPADDSDSDAPTRTPRKHFGVGSGAFEGNLAGAGGLFPGDLATAGTPSNLGKVGDSTLADADPLGVNVNVTFDQVGGLDEHINSLKEMTLLPLLYPEVFQNFNVTPPRGVLFHGPPGTGKTLLARALATSCRTGGREITFFMRKGADALSKWVGEAERQLRLLFEEARASQPSIIFFDEIDGLAPVRSSKQDQIHASIVSTLLALMDGMDGRGQVIVIGATNRPDAIDPALRRPGRFDREFYFPLPSLEARERILGIMTKGWKGWGEGNAADDKSKNGAEEEGVSGATEDGEKVQKKIRGLAKLTKGYGGADLRALCTEAALNAIQRKYPQIYKSNDRLLLKPETIEIGLRDFMISIKKIVPSSARSSASAATPLPSQFVPLLTGPLDRAKALVGRVLPVEKKLTALEEAEYEDYEGEDGALEREMTAQSMEILRVHRPRVILHGPVGMGQAYVGAALLHHLEGYHIQSLELGMLIGDSARTVEAALVQLFVEAKRHSPSVIYIPSLVGWCAAISETARATVRAMLDTLAPTDPILLLAIVDGKLTDLPRDVRAWFGPTKDNRVELTPPDPFQRSVFFQPLIEDIRRPPNQFPDGMKRKKRILEELPIAPPLEPRQPTERELALQEEHDQRTITMLKYRLGPIMGELKRKYKRFTKRAREEYKEEFDYIEMTREGTDPGPVAQAMATTIEIVEDTAMDVIAEDQQQQSQQGHMVDGHAPGGGHVNGIEVIPVPITVVNINADPHPAADLEPEPLPQLFDMDLEKMHEYLYKDRYLTPNEFLEDVRKIVHNAAIYMRRDPDRHFKAQAMLTATQLSIQDFDPPLRMECERVAKRERKRREEYKMKMKEKKALEKGKEKSSDVDSAPALVLNGTRRSARNNGQEPELAITDPVALERRLKRQREGFGETGLEEESATERDTKRSKTLEDSNERDPLDIRTPLRTPPRHGGHGGVRFAGTEMDMDSTLFPQNVHQPQHQPSSMFDGFQPSQGSLSGYPGHSEMQPSFYNMPQQSHPFASSSNSNSYPAFQQHDLGMYNHPQDLSTQPSSFPQPHDQSSQQSYPLQPQYPSLPQFSQASIPQLPYSEAQFQVQTQHHQGVRSPFRQQPGPSAPVSSMLNSDQSTDMAMAVDRPPSAPRNGGVAMLLNPVKPGEVNEHASSRPAVPQNSSQTAVPVPGDDGNPFLMAPAPQSRRNSPQPPTSILKSPQKAPTPIPIIERTPTPLPDFHIDNVLVEQLHASLRESTSDLTVEELEQLRAACLGCVWRHRSDWSRDSLVRELQDLVNDFVAEIGADASDVEL